MAAFRHGESPRPGKSATPLYMAWLNMRQRCLNSTHRAFKWYGGRGIIICSAWDDYLVFVADMGPHPGKGWTLERNNTNGPYDKANCTWARPWTQQQNKRVTVLTDKDVDEIRRRYVKGVNQHNPGNGAILASKFGVTIGHIHSVAVNNRWSNAPQHR